MSADADGDYVLATDHEAALAAAQQRYADGLAAWRANNAYHAAEIERLRAKLRQLAGECAECGGTGEVMTKRGIIEHVPCPECRDIRELLPEATP